MAGRFTVRLVGCVVMLLCVAAALASSASAFTTATWTGQSTSNGNWSNNNNWNPATAPSGTGTTLDFPALASCSPPSACYNSINDVAGITSNTLVVDLGANSNYVIGGLGITLTGGLTTMNNGGSGVISLPITFGANNLWSITGDLRIDGQIPSSTTDTWQVDLSNGGVLTLTKNDEVGDMHTVPADSSQTGVNAVNNGIVALVGSGELNGTDGHTVTMNQTTFTGAGRVGDFHSFGGELQVGAPGAGTPGILAVDGNVVLDGTSATLFTIKNGTSAPVAGTDFGQLAPTADVNLAGELEVLINHFTCPTLQPGAVYTLMSFPGARAGTFSNAPDGAVITAPNPAGCGAGDQFRINYTAHTVTATVVSNGPSTGPGGSGASPPVINTPPSTTGTTFLGQTVTSTTGTWSGTTPLTFTFQWQRCKTTCSDIPGANGPTYKVANADIGSKVRAVVKASNSAGSASAPSNLDGPVNLSAGQLKQLLKGEITKAASIRAILRAGGSTLNVSTQEPGVLQVSWYFVPPGAHVAARPVRVATGKITFAGAGPGKLKLKLTRAGRRLLRHPHRLKLTSKGTFTPSGGHPVSVTKRFKLKR